MEKEFVPYEISCSLIEKGFDEECLAYYSSNGDLMPKKDRSLKSGIKTQDCHELNVLAPMYQQAIDWFYGKGIHIMYLKDRDALNHQMLMALKHLSNTP